MKIHLTFALFQLVLASGDVIKWPTPKLRKGSGGGGIGKIGKQKKVVEEGSWRKAVDINGGDADAIGGGDASGGGMHLNGAEGYDGAAAKQKGAEAFDVGGKEKFGRSDATDGRAGEKEERVGANIATKQHRRLGSDVLLEPKRHCTQKGEDNNEACGGNQDVTVENVFFGHWQIKRIYLGYTKGYNDFLTWYCAGTRERVKLDAGNIGPYNTVEVRRRTNERVFGFYGFMCNSNPVRNKCDENTYGQDDFGQGMVNIQSEKNGAKSCMEVNKSDYPVGGVDEYIQFANCNDEDQQKFILYPTDTVGSFKLRPKDSVDINLDICVGSNGNDVYTKDCSPQPDLVVSSKKIQRVADSSKCVVDNGSSAAQWTCDGNTNMEIISNSKLTVNVNGFNEELQDVKYFPYSTRNEPKGEGFYLVQVKIPCSPSALSTKVSLHGAVWVQMGIPVSDNIGGSFFLKDGVLFQFKFRNRGQAQVRIAICLITRSRENHCFDIAGGGDDVVQPSKTENDIEMYRFDLSEYEGEVTDIGFVQGDSESKRGHSFFESIALLDAVDALRYVGCYYDVSNNPINDGNSFTYDQCHKECYDQKQYYFSRDAEGLCRCTSNPNLSNERSGCSCSQDNIGNIGFGCVYEVKPVDSSTVELNIFINGEDKTITEFKQNGNQYPEYVGYAENDKETERSIRLIGHEEVTFEFESPYEATDGTALEFTFTLEDEEVEEHAICLNGNKKVYCFDLLNSEKSNEDLEKNTDGQVAKIGEKSSYRTQLDKFLVEKETDQLTSISLRQKSKEILRGGKSMFENVMLYSFKGVEVISNLRGSVTLEVKDVTDDTIQFKPEVLLQDSAGSYARVPVAEKKILPQDKIIINNIIPGRRYVITLKPVKNTGEPVDQIYQNNKARVTLVTSCSCEESSDEVTGNPKNVAVSQNDGKVRLEFTDASVCEEAYSLTRKTMEGPEDSFAPNYFFYSADPCSNERITPGDGFEDNIRRSGLLVGNSYQYCVRAVGRYYMVNQDTSNGVFDTSSEEECIEHEVHWEASAIVKVTLKEESGSLPVMGATVKWKLMTPRGTTLREGTETTLDNGEITIAFNEPPYLEAKQYYFNGNEQYPLQIQVEKQTGVQEHTFLCNNEEFICPEEGTTVYLSHLHFGKTAQFADSTSVPISGTVYIGKRGGDGPVNTGCPLPRAEVCLYRKQTKAGQGIDTPDSCVTTDSTGRYSLPATLGTTVYPKVTFSSHTIEPLNIETGMENEDKKADYVNGIIVTTEASDNGEYDGHDFYDTTLTSLVVEVAGGVCNHRLGISTIEVRLEGCPEYKETFAQDNVRGSWVVPAHTVLVNIESMTADFDREFVMQRLSSIRRRVNLTDVDEFSSTEETTVDHASPFDTNAGPASNETIVEEEALKERTEATRLARFQYDGTFKLEPEIETDKDTAGNCSNYMNINPLESMSFHVVQSKEVFDLTVYVRQLILPPEGDRDATFCDIVDSATKVMIQNNVGLVAGDLRDGPELNTFINNGEDVSKYTACTQGCSLPVQVPEGEETRSKVTQTLQAGIPRIDKGSDDDYPYTKQIILSTGSTIHTMKVVVEGDYGKGGNSFPLPTHNPLLVIRDPPGGESSATYSNVQTTVKITMDNYEKYQGVDAGAHAGAILAGGGAACVGMGAMGCAEVYDNSGYVGGYVDGGTSWLQDFQDDSHSHGFTVTWSYATGGEFGQGNAGKDSDAFLVPTISILFRETDTITFDQTLCKADKSTTIKFDLSAAENKRTLSFLTYRQLSVEILPKMRNNLKDLESDDMADENNIQAVNASLNAWVEVFDEYEETNLLAKESASISDGKLENVGKWYTEHATDKRPDCQKIKYLHQYIDDDGDQQETYYYAYECVPPSDPPIQDVCENFVEKCTPEEDIPESATVEQDWKSIGDNHDYWKVWDFRHPKVKDVTGALAPNKLLDNATVLSSTNSIVLQGGNIPSLDSTGRVQFAGGGDTFEISFDQDKLKTIQRKWDDPYDTRENADQHVSGGIQGDATISVGAGILAGFSFGAGVSGSLETSHRMIIDDETEEQTSISVEFGDPDAGDEFLVDMYLDPKYGTLVFHTVDGQSKCPNEAGTRPIEQPSVRITGRDPLPVAQDKPIVFDLEIKNTGYGDSSFYLFTENRDNTGGLSIQVNGADLSDPSTWFLPSTELSGTATTATLTIDRGPIWHTYPPVTLYLQSKCEFEGEYGSAKASDILYNQINGNQRNIHFIEPCIDVQWAGDLKRKETFVINDTSEKTESGHNTLDITIFNPLYIRKKMAQMTRLESVKLEYRKVSDGFTTWRTGQTEDSKEINFNDGREDDSGYATVAWKIPVPDAAYEIRVKSQCSFLEHAPAYLNQYFTEIIVGVIDRQKPEAYGLPTPSVNLYPGEELVVAFTEDLQCELPYRFSIFLNVSEFEKIFDSDDMNIICSGNTIGLQFKEERIPGDTYSKLLGRTYDLTIKNVFDMSLNKLETYEYSSNFICLPPVPELIISHPSGPDRQYLPHQPIVFEAVLTNSQKEEKRATSYMELGVDLLTNTADFEVLVNGEPLAVTQQYIIDGNETVATTVTISKGPGKQMQFLPITVFLRSSCAEDAHNPVQVTAELWNWEDQDGNKFIKFTSPCPEIRWAGEMQHFPRFVVNGDALTAQNSLLEVSIFNQDYTDRKLFDCSVHNTFAPLNEKRLNDVVLLYQRIGDWNSSTWEEGKLIDSSGNFAIAGRSVDFSMASIEDGFGYSTLSWDLSSLADSTYIVKVVSRCNPISDAHAELGEYSTDTVQVVIDKIAPRVYGIPSLELPQEMHPSKEFVIPFTEDIYCEYPFTFDLQLILDKGGDTTILQDKDGIHVKCEGQSIKYRFDRKIFSGNAYSTLFGSDIKVTLKNVEDIARNKMTSEYEASYNHCSQAFSRSEIFRGMGCDNTDNDCDLVVDECDEDLIAPSMMIPDLIKVDTLQTNNILDKDVQTIFPVHLMKDICFNSTDTAKAFLLANIVVSDDCAETVDLAIDYISSMSDTGLAAFLATATDKRCEGGGGNHVHTEIFKVEMFDGFDTQGLLSDNTIVRGMGCDRSDQNCNGIIDDCDEDLVPPTIYMSEGVMLAKRSEHEGKFFITSHCFDSSGKVADFLEQNVFADDDCAQNITIDIQEVTTEHTWKKNHKYNLAEYVVTATDSRCGSGPYWSVEKTFLVEVFDEYDEDVKQQGCNGVDENCNGIVDDCSEDRSPPIVSIKETLPVSAYNGNKDITFIENPTFATIEDARNFLFKNIKVADDCATVLNVDVSSPIPSCAETLFTVAVSDPRCSATNPMQTVTKDFVLRVDGMAPTVSVGFDYDIDPLHFDVERKFLHIPENDIHFVNVLFRYQVEDNCPQRAKVEVMVTSNEFEYDEVGGRNNGKAMVLMRARKDLDQSHAIQVYVEPDMCKEVNKKDYFCDKSPGTAQVRFYEINVKVTDYGGNVGAANCTVIVVPKDHYADYHKKNRRFDTNTFFIDMIADTQVRHLIQSMETEWEIAKNK